MSRHIKFLAISIVLGSTCFALIFNKFYPGEYFSSDQAYKVKQIRDLVDGNSWDFSCVYPGAKIDPNFDYIPAKYPMIHFVNGKCYYVFPFHFSLFNIPFYKIWNQKGIFFASIFWGILYLIVWVDLLFRLEIKKIKIFLYSLVLIFGLGISFYIFVPSDHISTCFFCLLGYSAFLFGRNLFSFIIGGIALGFAVSIRAETLIYAILIFLTIFLRKEFDSMRKKYYIGIFTFFLIFSIFLISNAYFLDHLLGMRGHEFDEKKNEFLVSRFYRIFIFFIGRESEGTLIRDTPIFLAILFTPFILKNFNIEDREKFRNAFFVVICYIFLIPLLIKVDPFLQFGERYLLVIYPIFLVLLIFMIEKSKILNILKVLLLVFVILSSVYSCIKSFSLVRKLSDFTKYSLTIQKDIENKVIDSEVVVLRSLSLNGIYLNNSDLNKKIFLAVSDEKFLNLIQKLRENRIQNISIVHIKVRNANINFVKESATELSKSFIPENFKYKNESSDLGNEWIELRNYKL